MEILNIIGKNKNYIRNKEVEYENALNIATKYLKQVSSHPSKKQRELIYSKLVRSGYSSFNFSKLSSLYSNAFITLEQIS